MIDARMLADEIPVNDGAGRVEATVLVKMLPERRANGVVIEEHRADMAAALDQAQNLSSSPFAQSPARLRRLGKERLVGFDDLTGTADHAGSAAVVHRQPNAVHQEPCGFHAAAERALYLAGR